MGTFMDDMYNPEIEIKVVFDCDDFKGEDPGMVQKAAMYNFGVVCNAMNYGVVKAVNEALDNTFGPEFVSLKNPDYVELFDSISNALFKTMAVLCGDHGVMCIDGTKNFIVVDGETLTLHVKVFERDE